MLQRLYLRLFRRPICLLRVQDTSRATCTFTTLGGRNYTLGSDPVWLDFLNGCREATPTQTELDAVLPPEKHAVSYELAKQMLTKDDVVLTSHRRDRQRINNDVFDKTFGNVAGAAVDVGIVVTPHDISRAWLASFLRKHRHFLFFFIFLRCICIRTSLAFFLPN